MAGRSRILFYYLITVLLLLQIFTKIVVADEFDEEELVNSQEPEPVQEPFNEPVPEPKPLDVPSTRVKFEISDFYQEIILILCIVPYLINYFVGKQVNEHIARKWMEAHVSLFRDNFALVGARNDDNKPLIRDGPADYLFYLSGRRNCQYVHGRITLKPRHNLIKTLSNIITSQFSSKIIEDTVTFNVHMNNEDYDRFVFAITNIDHSRELRESRYDLNYFTKQTNNNLLPKTFHVQSESHDITDTILTKQVIEFLGKAKVYLNALIVTDQPRIKPEKVVENPEKLLTVICSIPNNLSKVDETLAISELIMFTIDFIPKCSFRSETVSKLKRNREDADKVINKALEAERQEAIQQEKAQKKRAEAERVAKLSPEEQRKHEEKERKREMKKKQKKLIKKA